MEKKKFYEGLLRLVYKRYNPVGGVFVTTYNKQSEAIFGTVFAMGEVLK